MIIGFSYAVYPSRSHEDLFIARCDELVIVTQGSTHEGAKAAIEEAILLYIRRCMDRGIFGRLTARLGGRINTKVRPMATGSQGVAYIEVFQAAAPDQIDGEGS